LPDGICMCARGDALASDAHMRRRVFAADSIAMRMRCAPPTSLALSINQIFAAESDSLTCSILWEMKSNKVCSGVYMPNIKGQTVQANIDGKFSSSVKSKWLSLLIASLSLYTTPLWCVKQYTKNCYQTLYYAR
jgi:hypothetical protein